ncbi:MAG: 3-hydroxyisobutyrate dehydrogenase-like beta-hydroxyacid dehydrogenase [Cellvibrionaceae bacterium]|jgi:3-hydroxyisobutyrate dehydrogenase-like beta-hydroxyacid dehydrogenase
MGVAVAQTMVNSGNNVYWISAGRSDATRQRAEAAGLIEVSSGIDMIATCQAIVCVCPPHAAVDVAEMVIGAGFKGIYVDANAIAPRTAKQIGALMHTAGVDFVDGGIIGGPPTKPATTWLYLSGPKASTVENWFAAGPLETELLNDQIGAASGIKMCFAASTKAYNALLTAVMGAAEGLGVRNSLENQWDRYTPGFSEQKKAGVTSVAYNKAWRFTGEMEEMVKTWEDLNIPNGFFEASAEVYQRIGHLRESAGEQTIEEVLKQVQGQA